MASINTALGGRYARGLGIIDVLALFLCFAGLLQTWLLLNPAYSFQFIAVSKAPQESVRTTLPFISSSERGEKFTIKGMLEYQPRWMRQLVIVPDDCVLSLTLNGNQVPLEGYSREELCNWRDGFPISIGSYLQVGVNSFRLVVENSAGGRHSLRVYERFEYPLQTAVVGIYLLALFAILFYLCRRLGVSRLGYAAVVLGVCLRLLYFSHTDFAERMHDVLDKGGHLDYVKVVAETGGLPDTEDGWEYHQQPLYYVIAAGVYYLTSGIGGDNNHSALASLQLLSLLFSVGFVVAGVLTLEYLLAPSAFRSAALFFFTTFPSGVVHASRLGNDGLLYLTVSLGIYWVLKWYEEGRQSALYWASFWSGLAVLSKLSGVMAVGLLFTALCAKTAFGPDRRAVLTNAVCPLILLVFLLTAAGYFSRCTSESAENADWMMGSSTHSLHDKLMLENRWINYLYLDLRTFLDATYADPWKDESGRQYFWNYFLKTSLFGEWYYPGDWTKRAADTLSALLVLLLGAAAVAYLKASREDVLKAAPLLLCVFVPILLVMLFRLKVPASPSADFRFALPVCIYFSGVLLGQLERLSSRGGVVVPLAGTALVLLFAAVSCFFFVVLQPHG